MSWELHQPAGQLTVIRARWLDLTLIRCVLTSPHSTESDQMCAHQSDLEILTKQNLIERVLTSLVTIHFGNPAFDQNIVPLVNRLN